MVSTATPVGGLRPRARSGRAPRRLVGLEFRRGVTVWMIPVALLPLLFVLRQDFTTPVSLWVETSTTIRDSLATLAPVFAGAAAWMASREHRRGAGELLGTTPLPAPGRWVATWAGSALAACLGGAVFTVPLLILTATRATWGEPEWWPIVVGLSAMIANTAVGFTFGSWFPSRFTAPAIVVLLFLGEVYVGTVAGHSMSIVTYVSRLDDLMGEWRYLSPLAETSDDLLFGIWPAVGLWQTLWLLGGTGVMLSLVALRNRPTVGAGLALAVSLAVSLGGATEVVQRTPGADYDYNAYRAYAEGATPLAYRPTCQGSPIVVCLHPAYEAWLEETATRANRVLAPIAGRPDVPMSIIQESLANINVAGLFTLPEGTVVIWLSTDWVGSLDVAMELTARCVVQDCDGQNSVFITEEAVIAQEVITRWLLLQAGEPINPYGMDPTIDPDSIYDSITPYVTRFAALSPAEQQRWFDDHLADLIDGRLTLADLP